ncbi:hypothetical protein EDB19DRAFT_1917028 [Suillus lakei]|nr:hypothetical protein EDB19DRAFT_1917028 [Suillus lakei]
MVIVIGAMYFCGTFSITSNSRMMFAFARDGGIPGHTFFRKVDSKRGTPVRTAIPIALRVFYRQRFVRGPFHLGAFSIPIAVAAVTWIAFIAIVFLLPQANPVDSQTLNYAVVAVGIVIVYSVGFWILSARKWFVGPVRQISGVAT